jgi:hypothetical protein
MRHKLLLAVAVVAAVALIAPSASALSKPRLSFVKSGGATIGWSTTGGSSPEDPYPNGASIRIVAPAGGGASAYTYGASEKLVAIRGLALDAISHLGFDSHGYIGNGAPRISLGTVTVCGGTGQPACRLGEPNGTQHTLFLAAYYCNDPLSGGWRTSDFTNTMESPSSSAGALGGCNVLDQTGTPLGPLGLDSAAAAYPNDVVQSTPSDWFLIQDESPATLNVDRLSVQEWMWVRAGTRGIVNCNSGDCV